VSELEFNNVENVIIKESEEKKIKISKIKKTVPAKK
jgi:hypothetical protein